MKLGKTILTSTTLNDIIDISDEETNKEIKACFNQDQICWLNNVLKSQVFNPTDEFKNYIGQFTEGACNRVQIPSLVRKSFINGRFDSYYYEDHDVAQQVLTHW